MPRWWVSEREIAKVMGDRQQAAYLAYKNVTSPTNQRTMIAAFVPYTATLHPIPLILTSYSPNPRTEACLFANLNSFIYDFVARQKVGGLHLSYFIVEQLPTLPPEAYADKCPWSPRQKLEKWISDRVLKLTCTAEDMIPLAEAAGFSPPVHRWNEKERAWLRAELDAAYFILYGIDRDDVDYILSTFQGVRDEDKAHGGEGPTRQAILECYERFKTGG